MERRIGMVERLFNKVNSISKPKEKPKWAENIKIDNITIDGKEGGNWEDFIKIDNGPEGGSNKGRNKAKSAEEEE